MASIPPSLLGTPPVAPEPAAPKPATPKPAAPEPAAPEPAAPEPAAPKVADNRLWELDAMRGLMLVLMMSTHLPTRIGAPLSQPFGFVSAAEGFVLLSAYMAGMIYTKRALRDGLMAMHRAFLNRAFVVYMCQVASLLFLFTVIAALGFRTEQPAVHNLMSFFLSDPTTGFWGGILLVYNPPLLDILPLYVVFMLVSPWILTFGLKRGWTPIFVVSGGLWLASQFSVSAPLYQWLVDATGLTVPFRETGSFETLAWQFLWVFGLWLGAHHAKTPRQDRKPFPISWVAIACVVGVVFMVWRHIAGNVPFTDYALGNVLFDKWRLGPMRMLDFFALLILTMHFGPWLKAHLPRMRWMEDMGSASLPVFCAHLVLVLLVLSYFGEEANSRSYWVDITLFFGSMLCLYGVAKVVLGAEAIMAKRQKTVT